jgi:transcriptional regulator with XRE-family HTH domain
MDKSIHNSSYKAVMNLLRNKRIERSITQEKMAELLEISQATLSKIETCERRLDIIELRQFCSVLNIPFVDFITEIQYL